MRPLAMLREMLSRGTLMPPPPPALPLPQPPQQQEQPAYSDEEDALPTYVLQHDENQPARMVRTPAPEVGSSKRSTDESAGSKRGSKGAGAWRRFRQRRVCGVPLLSVVIAGTAAVPLPIRHIRCGSWTCRHAQLILTASWDAAPCT